jgi:hypothetical protein
MSFSRRSPDSSCFSDIFSRKHGKQITKIEVNQNIFTKMARLFHMFHISFAFFLRNLGKRQVFKNFLKNFNMFAFCRENAILKCSFQPCYCVIPKLVAPSSSLPPPREIAGISTILTPSLIVFLLPV